MSDSEHVSPLVGLTPRQSDVARLVAACLLDKDIAAQLRIAEPTVKRHEADIAQRWGLDPRLSRRAQIIRRVVDLVRTDSGLLYSVCCTVRS